MNRSWKHNSSGSPGFVYFNVNNSYQNTQGDTSDFLSFGNSPTYGSPKLNRFSPMNHSSPQKYQKSPGNLKFNNYRYSGGQHNNSFNSSNNSFNNSRRRYNGPQHKRKFNISNDEKKDMSQYFDHTCVKNPWAELEEKLKMEEESKADKNEATLMSIEESSSSSEEEQDRSESESKSNTSGAEEDTT